MTEGERKFAEEASAWFWLAVALAALSAILEAAFATYRTVQRMVHSTGDMPPIGATLREEYTLSEALTIFACIVALIVVVAATEFARDWRKSMPNFIWPAKSSDTPSGVARFGRVLHWIFATFAALSVLGGAYSIYDNWARIADQTQAQIEWDRSHPAPDKPGYVLEYAPDEDGILEYRPTVPNEEYAGLWLGLAAAAFFLLIGRGVRYILANE